LASGVKKKVDKADFEANMRGKASQDELFKMQAGFRKLHQTQVHTQVLLVDLARHFIS
jgi:hypothetical protein